MIVYYIVYLIQHFLYNNSDHPPMESPLLLSITQAMIKYITTTSPPSLLQLPMQTAH